MIKYEIVTIDQKDITVDVSLLGHGSLWFNATEIADKFNKEPYGFLRAKSTKEYVAEILNDPQAAFLRFEDLVRTVHGGKYKGTWLHTELAFEFAGWCSATFRRKLHKWAEERLHDEHNRQQCRLALKTGYLPLTKAIQGKYDYPKSYHYSNEADLLNRIVTGLPAKKYKQIHAVKSVRDGLSAAESQLMEKLQIQDAALIELGFDFEDRKQLLTQYKEKYFNQLSVA